MKKNNNNNEYYCTSVMNKEKEKKRAKKKSWFICICDKMGIKKTIKDKVFVHSYIYIQFLMCIYA